MKYEDLEVHSHVGDVLHLRLGLQDGECVDTPLRIHAGDPVAAANAIGRASLRGQPRISRAHRHPDHHNPPPPAAPPRPGPSTRRGESPAPGSPGAHLGCQLQL